MKTRQKDFTGCHPKIAEALKQRQEVYCNVWDASSDKRKEWVVNYIGGNSFPYITRGSCYKFAEPVVTFSRVKSAEEIIQWSFTRSLGGEIVQWRGLAETT